MFTCVCALVRENVSLVVERGLFFRFLWPYACFGLTRFGFDSTTDNNDEDVEKAIWRSLSSQENQVIFRLLTAI